MGSIVVLVPVVVSLKVYTNFPLGLTAKFTGEKVVGTVELRVRAPGDIACAIENTKTFVSVPVIPNMAVPDASPAICVRALADANELPGTAVSAPLEV